MMYQTAKMLCLAKFFATAALCLMVFTSPALADPLYYAAEPTTSEIKGNFSTQYFTAKIHLVESGGQLMLTQIVPNKMGQYETKFYPINFDFAGNGWSATLAMPIHMEIDNSFNEDDHYSSVIHAAVNFKSTDEGQTQIRHGIATLRLVKTDEWSSDETVSLNIVDADDPSITLYDSSHEIALVYPDVKESSLSLDDGQFSIHKHMIKNTSMALYQAQVYNGLVYLASAGEHAGIDAETVPNDYRPARMGSGYTAPITEISLAANYAAPPAPISSDEATVIPPTPITQGQTVITPAEAPVIPQPIIPTATAMAKPPVSAIELQPVVIPAAMVAPAAAVIPPQNTEAPNLSNGSFLLRHTQQ